MRKSEIVLGFVLGIVLGALFVGAVLRAAEHAEVNIENVFGHEVSK